MAHPVGCFQPECGVFHQALVGKEAGLITAREIDEYRKCDLSSCEKPARWEFTVRKVCGRPYRVYVCGEHEIEGFARARELG